MDPVTGALVAAAIAWASILLARRVPLERAFGARGLRLLAAGSLVVLGLGLVGLRMGPWGWVALLALAFALALAKAISRPTAR